MQVGEKKFDDIHIGDSASFERSVSEADIDDYAEISGDHNPLHTDEIYANTTEFKGRIVHGLFLGALVSRLIGMDLPGKHALLLRVSLEFKKPARAGDGLLVKGVVVSKSQSTQILEIKVEISKKGTLLVSGTAHVKVV